jgi:Methyltransferase domain
VAEYRLFDGAIAYVSTYGYHEHRERAPHLEQAPHRGRLQRAANFVIDAVNRAAFAGPAEVTVSDLGCGDGGLLSLVQDHPLIGRAVGYDWAPANAAAWPERGVTGYRMDVLSPAARRYPAFNDPHPLAADIVVMTEVLEHLADPHGTLRWATGRYRWLVCSSPRLESDRDHDASHAWAWDPAGYAALVDGAGWAVVRHELVDQFQVVLAESVSPIGAGS